MNHESQKNEELSSIDPAFWNDRYQNNETGWDMHQVSPPLKKYIDGIKDKNLKILIPGCGNAYEAEYLLDKGFNNVTLVDFSKVLTDRLKEKYKNRPINIVNENYFDLKGKFDLILEQTFFCALHPSLRKNYVKKSYDLLNRGGKIAGVFFNKKFAPTEPPYIATDEEYREYFQPAFHFAKYEPCKNSIQPRLGYEVSFEFEKVKIKKE